MVNQIWERLLTYFSLTRASLSNLWPSTRDCANGLRVQLPAFAMAGLNDAPFIQRLAVTAVCLLVAFLSYFSQYLFHRSSLDPGPPSKTESVVFNVLLLCLWLTYFRTVTVDPGCYIFRSKVIESDGRWCKKCVAPKPPRVHHCCHCRWCIPKMDHHCPFTHNCVSMTTFPHFLRFLLYTNLSLWMLARLLWQRFYALWETRHLPSYLGPSLRALIALALISLVCSATMLALAVMLITAVKAWLLNCTMIEGWELDRHEAFMDRGERLLWDSTEPTGEQMRHEKIEFPYDIGFFPNMAQAMGTSNPLLWLFPFAGNPTVDNNESGRGWRWEENGFNPKEGMWPPLDPDKVRRTARPGPGTAGNAHPHPFPTDMSPEEQKQAFIRSQELDSIRRKLLLAELEELDDYDIVDTADGLDEAYHRRAWAWTNSDGERLQDYGVDEEAESVETKAETMRLQDDDMPLGEWLRRRRVPRGAEVTSNEAHPF